MMNMTAMTTMTKQKQQQQQLRRQRLCQGWTTATSTVTASSFLLLLITLLLTVGRCALALTPLSQTLQPGRSVMVSTTQHWATTTAPAAPLFVDATIREGVQTYYGETLSTSADLATNACCTGTEMPSRIKSLMTNLHPDTVSRYYGCGLCLPDYDLTGKNVLDLGCGAGRDVYLASQLVGSTGRVVGVDMTEAQLTAAREKQSYHTAKFGYDNVDFVKGYLEELDDVLTGQAGTFDLIISNCVLNLCTDKKKVLSHCYNLLKEGGEFYFSDVYCSRRIPPNLRDDAVLYGECLSGALYWNDFHNMARQVGFADPRLVEDAPITIANKKLQQKVAGYDFYSATYRLWKSADLEPDCEDYGQAVIYKGGLVNNNDDTTTTTTTETNGGSDYSTWKLDKGHVFVKGKVHPVCGNTYNMLKFNDKIAQHFDFIGDFSTHYGIFAGCGGAVGLPYEQPTKSSSSSGAACC